MMIEIVYRDVPIGILEDATIQFNNKQSFVDVNDLNDEIIKAEKYGTLEENHYLLDGSFKTFPNAPTNMEYMSEEMSDSTGTFATPIVMTRTFSNRYSATGMTIKFDTLTGDYCSKLSIAWYRSDELIDSATYYPTSSEFISNKLVQAFDKVVLTFYKTNKPYRYLKIHYLIDGMVRTFTDKELLNVELTEEISKTGETLPINTLTFDLIVENAVSYLFQNKQPMKLYHRNNFMGAFFIDTATQKSSRQFSIYTIDYIGILDTEKTYGGMYSNVAINTLLTEILGTIPYELDTSFSSKTITGYIPISSKRNALQQIAFSIGAIIDTSRSNSIKIIPYPSSITRTIGTNRVFRGVKTEIESLTTKIKLTEHNYYTLNETDTLYEDRLNGTITIELTEPHREYTITNGTIVASNVNYITISGTGSTVTLIGKKYTDKTRTLIRNNPLTISSTILKEIEFEECTLVSNANSEEVANRLADICFNNKTVDCKLILNNEKVGEKSSLATSYGTKEAFITSLITNLNHVGKYSEAQFMEVN